MYSQSTSEGTEILSQAIVKKVMHSQKSERCIGMAVANKACKQALQHHASSHITMQPLHKQLQQNPYIPKQLPWQLIRPWLTMCGSPRQNSGKIASHKGAPSLCLYCTLLQKVGLKLAVQMLSRLISLHSAYESHPQRKFRDTAVYYICIHQLPYMVKLPIVANTSCERMSWLKWVKRIKKHNMLCFLCFLIILTHFNQEMCSQEVFATIGNFAM